MGTSECPQFLQHVRENPDILETTYFTWAQGVLSGWNMRAMADKRDVLNLALMAPDQQQAHVREYCEKHPDSAYFVAVFDLIKTLRADPLNLRGDDKRSP